MGKCGGILAGACNLRYRASPQVIEGGKGNERASNII